MLKITFIGAGSTIFAKQLMADILLFPELAESEIALYDINAERLRTSEQVGRARIGKINSTGNVSATFSTLASAISRSVSVSYVRSCRSSACDPATRRTTDCNHVTTGGWSDLRCRHSHRRWSGCRWHRKRSPYLLWSNPDKIE